MELATFTTRDEWDKIVAIRGGVNRQRLPKKLLLFRRADRFASDASHLNTWHTALHNPDKGKCSLGACGNVLKWYGQEVCGEKYYGELGRDFIPWFFSFEEHNRDGGVFVLRVQRRRFPGRVHISQGFGRPRHGAVRHVLQLRL